MNENLKTKELPLVTDADQIPAEAAGELSNGKGEDENE